MPEPRERRLAQLQSLQRVGEAAAGAESPAEIFDAALAALVEATGAARAAILLFDADGVMRFEAWRGLSDGYRAAVDGHTPWRPDDADAATVAVPDVFADPSLAPLHPAFVAEGIAAVAFVPLQHRRRVIGKLTLYHDAPHAFAGDELRLAEAIARQIAFAVERHTSAAGLRQSAEELRTIFDLAPSGIGLVAPEDGRFLRVNPRLCTITGYSEAELMERTFRDLTHPDDRDWSFREAQRMLRGETPAFSAQMRYLRKDGEVVWVQVDATAIRDQGGRIVAAAEVVQDVTARRRAEESLRLALARNRAILATAVDAIITIDERGIIESLNPAAERMFGYSAAELVGQNVKVLMPSPYREEHDRYLASYLATGERKIIGIGREVLAQRRDGSVFPMELAVSEVMVGGRRSFIGMIRDVTERKAAEERLRRSEARWRLLARSGASLSSSLELATTLERVARTALPELADYAVVHLVQADGALRQVAQAHVDPAGEDLLAEIGARHHPEPEGGLLARVIATEEPLLLTGEHVAAAEQAAASEVARLHAELGVTSVVAVPLVARGRTLGTLALGTTRVSERRFTADDLQFAEELARRAALAIENAVLYGELRENDQRKDQFLAMLAHELRNPLAAILTSAELLDASCEDPQVRLRAVEILRRQARHMARLTDDLLDVSRFTRGKIELRREPVDLRALVRQVLQSFATQVEQGGYRLQVELPAEAVWLDADAVRIEQVLANLLGNSLKFTPPGGELAVLVRADGDQATLVVRDSGAGIDPAFVPHVFDLFAQEDQPLARAAGGLGIGLTLVRSLVELHGGKVVAGSAGRGKGSTFTVRLPLGAPVAPPSAARAGALCGRRILLVEDAADAADALSELLRHWGHQVAVARDAAAALAAAPDFAPEVVLLDLGLPGMDGYELATRLRRMPGGTGTLLVALTGYGRDGDRQRSAAAGIDHHLVKPVQPETLRRLLADGPQPAAGRR